jgi:hypothetical protein
MTSPDSRFKLLPFYCPIESAIHPKVDVIEQRAIAWIDQFHFYDNEAERAWMLGTNSAEFYARFAPDGIEDNLLIAAQWVYWGFAFDDARCDNGPLSARPEKFLAMAGPLQRALEVPHAQLRNSDPFAAALQDIGRSFQKCATPVQVRRFTEAHRAWLFGVAWQISNRVRNHMPSLDDYTAMRLNSAGGPPTLAMLEITNGMEVPAQEMDSPTVRALTEMPCLIAALDNDLHSYRKEVHQQQTDQNIINVLIHRNRCTVEQALTDAVAMRDRMMHLFLRLREQTFPRASQELRSYLTCLGHAIRGNTDWGLRVPRYTSLSDPTAPPAQGQGFTPRWTDEPSDPSTAPLPIPAIAWWWEVL